MQRNLRHIWGKRCTTVTPSDIFWGDVSPLSPAGFTPLIQHSKTAQNISGRSRNFEKGSGRQCLSAQSSFVAHDYTRKGDSLKNYEVNRGHLYTYMYKLPLIVVVAIHKLYSE